MREARATASGADLRRAQSPIGFPSSPATRGHHHAECAALENGQHFLLFWALQGGRLDPPDPKLAASVPIDPGDYRAIVTIVSDRRPIKREVEITCAKGSLSLRCR